jgi:hypothetical protein
VGPSKEVRSNKELTQNRPAWKDVRDIFHNVQHNFLTRRSKMSTTPFARLVAGDQIGMRLLIS